MGYNELASKKEAELLIELAVDTAIMLIRYGAEIYRAQDTAKRICNSRDNLTNIQVFGINSMFIISGEYHGEKIILFDTITDYEDNLSKIQRLNNFSRRFSNHELSIREGFDVLQEIKELKIYSMREKCIGGGLSAAGFSVLMGGGPTEFLLCICTGIFITYVSSVIGEKNLGLFPTTFLSCFVIGILVSLLNKLMGDINVNSILLGSILILLPGMTALNGLRDIMSDDYLTGVINLVKALLIALTIAFGVGMGFRIFSL